MIQSASRRENLSQDYSKIKAATLAIDREIQGNKKAATFSGAAFLLKSNFNYSLIIRTFAC